MTRKKLWNSKHFSLNLRLNKTSESSKTILLMKLKLLVKKSNFRFDYIATKSLLNKNRKPANNLSRENKKKFNLGEVKKEDTIKKTTAKRRFKTIVIFDV